MSTPQTGNAWAPVVIGGEHIGHVPAPVRELYQRGEISAEQLRQVAAQYPRAEDCGPYLVNDARPRGRGER